MRSKKMSKFFFAFFISKSRNCREFTKLMPETESRICEDHELWNPKMWGPPALHFFKRIWFKTFAAATFQKVYNSNILVVDFGYICRSRFVVFPRFINWKFNIYLMWPYVKSERSDQTIGPLGSNVETNLEGLDF